MDLSPFRLDIDELIADYAEGGSTSFADWKKVWLARKFSYIFEAIPSTNVALYMQSLYAHSIGYLDNTASFSHRLGGLYCLYCLYETQPFKPTYKIYICPGELKKLKELVVEAREKDVKVVSPVVKRMLEMNMFLVGAVDMNENSAKETVNQLMELQNARIQVAYNKLFASTSADNYIHMDMGMEVDLNVIRKMSTDYSEAKKLAIKEASSLVDVDDIKHITEDERTVGDAVGKIADDWNAQREAFYRQTKLIGEERKERRLEEDPDDENFENQLEQMLTDA